MYDLIDSRQLSRVNVLVSGARRYPVTAIDTEMQQACSDTLPNKKSSGADPSTNRDASSWTHGNAITKLESETYRTF